ncbi:MAG: peptidoglycan-binding protein, partial [Candidatus Sericytochromatia bacterium]|nr:peptidoglycan-binding protein [Candidatus Tanganyikabacteria bacterium]
NGNDISDAQVAALAKEYGLKATRANIEAFSNEVNSYRDNAIGPDAGDAATVKQLQAVLAKLGYKVQASGNFDESTTEAVIQFKVKHGIHQSYKLANGDFAINEYVDEATAQAMANALTK